MVATQTATPRHMNH